MEKINRLLQVSVAVVCLAASVPAVQAQTVFDFANLTNGNSSNFLPTNGVDCTGGDLCSASKGAALTFASGAISVDALGWYKNDDEWKTAWVVQDHETSYNGVQSGPNAIGAGLGVYRSLSDNGDDNVTKNEKLQLHFNQAVTLSAIGLRSDGHNTTSWSNGAEFKYSFDNSNWYTASLPKNVGQFALNHTGQDLYLRYTGDDDKNSQFYLSSMTVAAVPEPETYAMLLAGLGMLGAVARRRKQPQA